MMKKVISMIGSVIMMALCMSIFISAEATVKSVVRERTVRGNLDSCHEIKLYENLVEINIGYIPAGKILVISAIPNDGKPALDYISEIGLYPSAALSRGFVAPSCLMTWNKITQSGTYSLRVNPKNNLTEEKDVTIFTYTVDYIDGFSKYDAIEGLSGDKNYVVSNQPEMLGYHTKHAVENSNTTLDGNTVLSSEKEYIKTTLIDGTERLIPKPSVRRIIMKNKNEGISSNKIVLDDSMKQVFQKIEQNEKLSIGEFKKYKDFFANNDLTLEAVTPNLDVSQLGEYGYYLSKSKINGNANIFWEHVNLTGTTLYYGILLQNTSNSSIRVQLNKRSLDSTDDSGSISLATVWEDFFTGVKYNDLSDLETSSDLVIPANSAKWVVLDLVTSNSDGYYNIFTGQTSISIKTSSGNAYTGNDVYCYSFIMTNWTNASGQQMHELVKNNIGSLTFTRANGAPSGNTDLHISGSGNGARMLKSVNSVIDITNDRYSFLLAGLDIPYFNSGELMQLTHDGSATGGIGGYTIPNAQNYGVIYKISFQGLNSTTNSSIKLKLKYNRLTNSGAVEKSGGGIFATVYCPQFSNTPFKIAMISESGMSEEANLTSLNIQKNTPFDLYIVVGGMSTLPLEVEFYDE